jgi:seryl-tRNA synthetase
MNGLIIFAQIKLDMLQVSYLRQNSDLAKKKLAVKHFGNLDLVDQVIALDDERKLLQANFDDTQSKVNAASKEIGGFMAKGEKEKAEQLKNEVAVWKTMLEPLKIKMGEVEAALQQMIVQFPNLPHDMVPLGKTPEENVEVRKGGEVPVLPAGLSGNLLAGGDRRHWRVRVPAQQGCQLHPASVPAANGHSDPQVLCVVWPQLRCCQRAVVHSWPNARHHLLSGAALLLLS